MTRPIRTVTYRLINIRGLLFLEIF